LKGLRVATKLINQHINYFNEKMNVRLAAQVISDSVSDIGATRGSALGP